MEDILKKLPRALVEASKDIMEANKANKAKSSAFRAGKKAEYANQMNTSVHRSRYDSPAENKQRVDKAKEDKEKAKDKAEKMKISAKDKLRSLGRSSREVTTPYNKGKEVAKNPPVKKAISSKINRNVDSKHNDSPERKAEYAGKYAEFGGSGQNRGKFLQMHHRKQHEIIRRKIDDMHRSIRSKLNDIEPKFDATDTEGGAAIAKAKAHLDKMTKIHAALHESVDIEDYADKKLTKEDIDLVEAAQELQELSKDTLRSYSAKAAETIGGRGKKSQKKIKRASNIDLAKEKLSKILEKEHLAREKQHMAKVNEVHNHFQKEAVNILNKHGYTKVHSANEHSVYHKGHENGHSTVVRISHNPNTHPYDHWGAKYNVHSTNGSGTLNGHNHIVNHRDDLETNKAEAVHKFHSNIIDADKQGKELRQY